MNFADKTREGIPVLHGNLNTAVSPMERKHADQARKAAIKGFVLLRNDNHALTLSEKKVALNEALFAE